MLKQLVYQLWAGPRSHPLEKTCKAFVCAMNPASESTPPYVRPSFLLERTLFLGSYQIKIYVICAKVFQSFGESRLYIFWIMLRVPELTRDLSIWTLFHALNENKHAGESSRTNNFSRGTPAALIPRPTASSFSYTGAQSMWRYPIWSESFTAFSTSVGSGARSVVEN